MSGDKLSYTETVQAFNNLMLDVRKDISSIEKALHGNGQPGIYERVTRLEDSRDYDRERRDRLMSMIRSNTASIGNLKDVSHELKEAAELLADNPSLLAVIRRSPFRAAVTAAGAWVGLITLWFGLYALVSIPGVALWFNELLGLP